MESVKNSPFVQKENICVTSKGAWVRILYGLPFLFLLGCATLQHNVSLLEISHSPEDGYVSKLTNTGKRKFIWGNEIYFTVMDCDRNIITEISRTYSYGLEPGKYQIRKLGYFNNKPVIFKTIAVHLGVPSKEYSFC